MALNRADFHAIVERHGPALYRLAYRLLGDAHDAEEVVQEALRSAWSSRGRFDTQRSERAWLASILRRRAVDRWRSVGRTLPTVSGDHVLDTPVEGEDPLALDYTDEMQAALARLPEEMREALLLVVVGELTHQEAADTLGAPLGTVLSRVSRGRIRLRESLLAVRAAREPQPT
ncbi:RNA polymerase sigma factor [Botrimarina hoheduenensis]|uniref:ECF RNA polymerase sigma factor SigW n=1 Tax=Botrimarina hoheduenensis TaxID=2528000 RepID=A0A5C5VXP0_9BACT|nr:RNA polymerase sigma factor [Botrimarina hoheduenensis]TWT43210.1 ECF RNA polymerase sigma factor SigW [Botrimarina hoheduenensis]